MAERPAIQFYFGDWKKNKKLRFCSWGARGVWIEVMGLMHDSMDYGIIHQPARKIADALGAPRKLIAELIEQGVMYGCDKGLCEPMHFRPTHAGQQGDPVLLVPAQEGPIWYSPRMVRDEFVRQRRGTGTRFGGSPKQSPKGGIGEPPKTSPSHREGDGASASSSSSKELLSLGAGANPVEVIDGEGNHLGFVGPPDLSDARLIGAAQLANKRLRAVGIGCNALDPTLLALLGEKFNTEEMALMAAELVLKKAHFWLDSDMHPELHPLLASGATQQQMMLTDAQKSALDTAARSVGMTYIATSLRGRRQDAIDKASPPRRAATKPRPSANDNFEGKSYAGTAIDQLPPELRKGIELASDGAG